MSNGRTFYQWYKGKDGVWHLYAATFPFDGEPKFYIDGEQLETVNG